MAQSAKSEQDVIDGELKNCLDMCDVLNPGILPVLGADYGNRN